MNAGTMRLVLAACLLAMCLLAIASLRRRELGTGAYILWGLFALLVPALGPFLVIVLRPGKRAGSKGARPD